jgi:hypothetical protein
MLLNSAPARATLGISRGVGGHLNLSASTLPLHTVLQINAIAPFQLEICDNFMGLWLRACQDVFPSSHEALFPSTPVPHPPPQPAARLPKRRHRYAKSLKFNSHPSVFNCQIVWPILLTFDHFVCCGS